MKLKDLIDIHGLLDSIRYHAKYGINDKNSKKRIKQQQDLVTQLQTLIEKLENLNA